MMNTKEQNIGEISCIENISTSRHLLQRMSVNWDKRAQVKKSKHEILESELAFDEHRDDFRADLLPFSNHPDFLSCSPEFKQMILSIGWLMYNRKTVDIESRIVTPSCNDILYGKIPGLEDPISKELISEVMVDEAYHILLVVRACNITSDRRNLIQLQLPTFDLVTYLDRERSLCDEKWQAILVQFATSVVSEIFISDYLDLLSDDVRIQPFNRLTVATHRADEMAHHSIFKNLAKCMYHSLDEERKIFFAQALLKPLHWFASKELAAWQSVLQQINFPHWHRMTADCMANERINLDRVDYSGLIKLAEELEIKNFYQNLGDREHEKFGHN